MLESHTQINDMTSEMEIKHLYPISSVHDYLPSLLIIILPL